MSASRIWWTTDEIELVAKAFVALRLVHPLAETSKLVHKAMHKELPEPRWRKLASIKQVPLLVKRIEELFLEQVTKPSEAEPPEPTVIQVEVERPVNYTELLAKLDGATIAALAVAKLEQVFKQVSVARVEPQAPGPAQPKPVSIIAAATPKPTRKRVAVVAMKTDWHIIEQRCNGLKDKLDLRFIDPDKSVQQIHACDYCVMMKTTSHEATFVAQQYIPNDRIFRVMGQTAMTQKLYDIASLQ